MQGGAFRCQVGAGSCKPMQVSANQCKSVQTSAYGNRRRRMVHHGEPSQFRKRCKDVHRGIHEVVQRDAYGDARRHAKWFRVVQISAVRCTGRCKQIQLGANVVQSGANRCTEVQSGANRCQLSANSVQKGFCPIRGATPTQSSYGE